jgi:hypothetical protein
MTGAAAALYPEQFEPNSTLLALNYFEDGDLTELSPRIRAQLSGAVRAFRGMEPIQRASDAMTLTEAEGARALNDLRARFTLAAANPSQREELIERAGWIGVELSGGQTPREHKQWKAFAQNWLERRPGKGPEAFLARAIQAKAQEQGHER